MANSQTAVVRPPFAIRYGESYIDADGRIWKLTSHGQWIEVHMNKNDAAILQGVADLRLAAAKVILAFYVKREDLTGAVAELDTVLYRGTTHV